VGSGGAGEALWETSLQASVGADGESLGSWALLASIALCVIACAKVHSACRRVLLRTKWATPRLGLSASLTTRARV
jgi:hypothetical protein